MTPEELYRYIRELNGPLFGLEGVTLQHPFFHLKQADDFKDGKIERGKIENGEYSIWYTLTNGEEGALFVNVQYGVLDHQVIKDADKVAADNLRKQERHKVQAKEFMKRQRKMNATTAEQRAKIEANARLQMDKIEARRQSEREKLELKRGKELVALERDKIKLKMVQLKYNKKP